MAVVDPGTTGPGAVVPGDLDRPLGRVDIGDHDLLIDSADPIAADPHRLAQQTRPAERLPVGAGQPVRHRVLAALESDHRRVRRHDPGGAERHRVRDSGDRMQPGPFLGQQLCRWPPGDPVRAGVDLDLERSTGLLQLSERGVLGQQVRLRRHQISLADPHIGLAATLRRRIRRHTGVHGHRVMRRPRHQLRVRTGIPAMWSVVTVFSLSVNT